MTTVIDMTDEQRELFDLGANSAKKRQPKTLQVTNLKGEVEWYTPPEYIEAARKVMGRIDVDPATSVLAQNVVKAKQFYTINTNGLDKPWPGNVWLNPPYAAAMMKQFVSTLIGKLDKGEVKQCIMLTHCNTDTQWYHQCYDHYSAICQTRGRVRFYNANGKANSPTHGHMFMYFGKRRAKFANVFRQFGSILEPRR